MKDLRKEIAKILSENPQLFSSFSEQLEAQEAVFFVNEPKGKVTNSLVFVSTHEDLQLAAGKTPPLIIASEKLAKLGSLVDAKTCLYLCKNIQLAMAKILPLWNLKAASISFSSGLSPYAVVHPSTKIGKNVTIAPYCLIGPNCEIGDDTVIGPHSLIEGNTQIGKNCVFQSHAYIGNGSIIQDRVILQSHVSIGTDGYGYAPTEAGALRIPQVGNVLIECDVEIGSNTCIDRATISSTIIGQGTKIDNLVHIAHNCKIGKHCFITAGFATAGSTEIGDYFMCGGTVAIADHIKIAPKVTLAGASVVTSDILESGQYGGSPTVPMADYLKTRASIPHLPTIRKQVTKILKHLNLNNE